MNAATLPTDAPPIRRWYFMLERAERMALLVPLVALGLLGKEGSSYYLTPLGEAYLAVMLSDDAPGESRNEISIIPDSLKWMPLDATPGESSVDTSLDGVR